MNFIAVVHLHERAWYQDKRIIKFRIMFPGRKNPGHDVRPVAAPTCGDENELVRQVKLCNMCRARYIALQKTLIGDFSLQMVRQINALQWIPEIAGTIDPNVVIEAGNLVDDLFFFPFLCKNLRGIHHIPQAQNGVTLCEL